MLFVVSNKSSVILNCRSQKYKDFAHTSVATTTIEKCLWRSLATPPPKFRSMWSWQASGLDDLAGYEEIFTEFCKRTLMPISFRNPGWRQQIQFSSHNYLNLLARIRSTAMFSFMLTLVCLEKYIKYKRYEKYLILTAETQNWWDQTSLPAKEGLI